MTGNNGFLDKMYQHTDDTPSETVRDAYDAWSDSYDQELVAENGYAMPDRATDAIVAHFKALANATVLDVGCGTGLAGVAIRARGATTVDGCDFSPGMLAQAETKGIYRRLFEANLNVPPLNAADESYDVAMAVGVFAAAHIKEIAVDEILRVTKPGGLVCLTTNDHYYEGGMLQGKLKQLEADGRVDMLLRQHGDHLPGFNVGGWVFVMTKA